MPNIATILKSEILRLAKKEVRNELASVKKASAQYRTDIAALKRQVAELEKQTGRLAKKSTPKEVAPEPDGTKTFRFSAARFAVQRKKQGLSAPEMGVLLGVSAQTVYNWEAGKSRPRPQQLAAIALVRAMGKRQLAAKLAAPQA